MGDLVFLHFVQDKFTIVEGGKMENWVIGKIPLEREDSEVTIRITSLLIPTFHYSMCGREAQVPIKSLYSQ